MKILKVFVAIFLVISAIVLGVLFYYGFFEKIVLTEQQSGGEWVVYKEMKGDYSNAGKAMENVYNELKEKGIETTIGYGYYLDNPDEVAAENLRSEIGCFLPEKYLDKQEELAAASYIVRQLPVKKCVVTKFPFKGFMSIMVGLIKVYPEYNKYTTEHNIKAEGVMEITNVPAGYTEYRMVVLE